MKPFKAPRYTAILCKECGKTLVSYNRHMYVTCGCPNGAMADGGAEYLRCGAMDLSKIRTGVLIFLDDLEKEEKEKHEKD